MKDSFFSESRLGGEEMNREIEILNPTAIRQTERSKLAPRRFDHLRQTRVGLLDNSKPNADHFLGYVGDLLKQRYDVALVSKRKMSRMEADCLLELSAECDVVINAFAD
jgi:hypothetical protein